jgi:hypothetical protein
VADAIDRIGQRLLCVPLLLGGMWWLSRRLGSLRPLIIGVGATLLLNFAVGVLKLASGRESPRTGGPELFVGDNVLFPSGHTANVIFHYGLLVALVLRYIDLSPWRRRLLVALVPATFLLMTGISVYRHTHWLSDLVAGGLIGTSLLCLSIAVDSSWSTWVRWLRRLAGPLWTLVERVVGFVRPYVLGRAGAAGGGAGGSGPPHEPGGHGGSQGPERPGGEPGSPGDIPPQSVRRPDGRGAEEREVEQAVRPSA